MWSETNVSDFPPFRLDRANQCVWESTPDGGERRLNLRPRAYDMLQYLVDNAGRLVTHDEFTIAVLREGPPIAIRTGVKLFLRNRTHVRPLIAVVDLRPLLRYAATTPPVRLSRS